MYIHQMHLKNFGRFEDLALHFAPLSEDEANKVTVLIGGNGVGKTTVLRALATALSWLPARIRTERGSGSPILQSDIRNGLPFAEVSLSGSDRNQNFGWTLHRKRIGWKPRGQTDLRGISRLADWYREQLALGEEVSLPMVAYYPIECDISLRNRKRPGFGELGDILDSPMLGTDIRRFIEWFRAREDCENERMIEPGRQNSGDDPESPLLDSQLQAFRHALAVFIPEFKKPRIRRRPGIRFLIDKGEQTLESAQLSGSEKYLLAVIGDLARRLSQSNPGVENPLMGRGVVLIDEIDRHLHPTWQRKIIQRLRQTFPNCQFVLTTHSPLVISDPRNLLCYVLNDDGVVQLDDLYGKDVNQVLVEAMDTDIQNAEVAAAFDRLWGLIQDGNLDAAHARMAVLKEELPRDHADLIKAEILIKRLEFRRAKNS